MDKLQDEAQAKLKPLRVARGTRKRKITIHLKNIREFYTNEILTSEKFRHCCNEIQSELVNLKKCDEQINEVMDQFDLENLAKAFYEEELDGQSKFSLDVGMQLGEYEKLLLDKNADSGQQVNKDLIQMMAHSINEGKTPHLDCGTFNGKEKDKFAFNTFINQFNIVIGHKKNLSKSTKLAYLIGYLRDYALSIIKHLSITDDNYELAIDMLRKEFLDEEFIVDETYKNILKAFPSFNSINNDPEFSSVKAYLNEIRAYLYELKSKGIDLLEHGSAGLSLISHIIFNKLPNLVKREFIHFLSKNYPTLSEVFDNYHTVLARLSKVTSVKHKQPIKSNFQRYNEVKPKEKVKSEPEQFKNKGVFTNFKTNQRKSCKLCGSGDHTLGQCDEFVSYQSKVNRLQELTLCTRCAGSGHDENQCFGKQGKLRFPCKICNTREHFTALCPVNSGKGETSNKTNVNMCLAQRSLDSGQILPTMTLTLKSGTRCRKVRCLIDTGSQRSYISEYAAKDLCQDINRLYELECEVCTYIGQETKEFKQMSTGIKLGNSLVFVPLLVDNSLNISFEVPGMNEVISKFTANNIKLMDDTFYEKGNHDLITVDMLLGIDVLHHMPSFEWKQIMGGPGIVMQGKVAPIGNVYNFLDAQQRKFVRKLLQVKCKGRESNAMKTMVNAVLDPIKSYFNPIDHILNDTEVDNGLEHLFSLESMGIKTDDRELVSIDKEQVEKFRKGIIFKEGKYHVELPWHFDKVEAVPSNHNVALKVLDRTMKYLDKKGLTERYQSVFEQQLSDGIIEEITVKPSEYQDKVWIPHRPVIKMDEQVTTKIRPVFNCSLKTNKELPSLNEATYTGIDLMNNILKLLFYFRTNDYVMLSDVKQAFLMIKLKNEVDQDRFCFFWKKGNKLITYRFKTIVFGFTSSPFILHYVMQHHANSFPVDKVSDILSNNFYVDNLLITGNEVSEMKEIYQVAYNRMKAGGFLLRSWNSNSDELRDQMTSDGRLVEHSCEEEKVLGYRYNVNADTLSLAHCKIDQEANTKRKVLSQTSKLFDPLNFALPITIRGKILMRKIWRLEVGWDDQLPKEMCDEMKRLSRDFEMISELSFQRQALNENESYGFHIFCDSSAESYGFVAYAVNQNNESAFLYAKSKLAPLRKQGNEHSIPTLELMGVILAFKCLPSILESYDGMQIQFLNISVDAQVVLNWLLTKQTKVKSKFLRNRILDASSLKLDLENKFHIPVSFHYVNTEENPADLVTKGLSYNKYLSKRKFWLEGPQWLSNDFNQWPKYPLLSISPEQKGNISTTFTVQPEQVNTGILNINKFSSFNKLIKCTSNLYKFLSKIKGCNPRKKAWEYWIKTAQEEFFNEELKFLQNTNQNDKVAPTLVSNLNLFLDDKGLIRSRGRISKCTYYNYDVHNPVLLPKASRFTQLFIIDCHMKLQHLGIGTTLNYIREQGLWIPKGRMAVKNALSSCLVCKRYNALAFKYPKFTNMPKHHMNLVKPFQHVGVDYTGHFWVKDNLTNQTVKAYILIFTCLNIRAVHFELVTDMSTKNFLLAFQRFCNTYSIPQYVYSDNAKVFLKGGMILEKALQSKEVKEELERCNIKHIKIPVYSAWIGSAWERLIRTMKNCLYKVIGRAKMTYFELLTSLSNIQLAMNSRPLTYRSSLDELEFITPNSFLKIHGNSSLILREDTEVWVDDQENLENTLIIQEEMFENFKKLWYNEYLLSLREHSRNLYQSNWENKIKVGDVVLIKTINKPRPYWLLGKVLELIIGSDSKVRTVKIKQGNGAIEYHSISNLYPLEVTVTHAGKNEMVPPEDRVTADDEAQAIPAPDSKERPKRKATERFKQMLKDKIQYL